MAKGMDARNSEDLGTAIYFILSLEGEEAVATDAWFSRRLAWPWQSTSPPPSLSVPVPQTPDGLLQL